MTENSKPVTWSERVRSAWDSCALPKAIVLDDYEPNTPDEWEAVSIQQWLEGKSYDEIVGTSEIDSDMPLHYLTDEACAYFLGAYLQEASLILDRLAGPGFAIIHFSHFVRSERFREVSARLNEDQRTLLFQLILVMLGKPAAFDLEEENIAGFKAAAALV